MIILCESRSAFPSLTVWCLKKRDVAEPGMTTATFGMSWAVSRILEEISTTRFSTKRGDWPDPKDFKKAKATPGCSAELSCNSEDIQVNICWRTPTPEIKGAYFICYVYGRKRGAASLGRGLPGVRYRQDGRSGTQVFRCSHPQKESQEVRINKLQKKILWKTIKKFWFV